MGQQSDAAVSQAVRFLQARQKELANELERIDAALTALLPMTGIPIDLPADSFLLTPQIVGRQTVKAQVLNVLSTDHRVFRSHEMIEEISRRGQVISAKNPPAAVRTAFLELMHEGLAVRTGYGAYRGAKWQSLAKPSTTIGGRAREDQEE
jgi:hypothetical protein